MKYKIGDKVLVRSDLEEGKKYGDEVVMSDMLFFKGKIVTIEHVDHPNDYRIKEDPDQWHWTDEMFDEKESEEIKSEYLPYCEKIDEYSEYLSYCEEIDEYFNSDKIYNPSDEFPISQKESTSNFIIVKSNRLKLLLL